MYDNSIQVTYLDKPHAYYAQERINWRLPEQDEAAWGKKWRPKGTTTLLADTLEKKGLMTWPMGMALTELFGFYDFVPPEGGNRLTGFSKGKGTFWELPLAEPKTLLPLVVSASKAWQRKQKQGADIGSLCHDYIEQYVLGTPHELTLERYAEGQDFADKQEKFAWLLTATAELEMAKLACAKFVEWWDASGIKLINAEQIVYSRELDYSGAYDGLLDIPEKGVVLADWKTSKASVAGGAPEGVYYSYFAQSAAYALALLEMGAVERIDDLLVVSARKDGGFSTVYASDLGITVEECIDWWKAIVVCYRMMDRTKKALVEHAPKRAPQAIT